MFNIQHNYLNLRLTLVLKFQTIKCHIFCLHARSKICERTQWEVCFVLPMENSIQFKTVVMVFSIKSNLFDCFVDNKLESKESFIFPLRKLFVYLITKHNLANANRCKQLSNQLNISSNCNIIENQSMHLIMASNPIGCIEVIHNIFLPFSFIKQFNWPFWLSGLHLDTLHNRKVGMLRQ